MKTSKFTTISALTLTSIGLLLGAATADESSPSAKPGEDRTVPVKGEADKVSLNVDVQGDRVALTLKNNSDKPIFANSRSLRGGNWSIMTKMFDTKGNVLSEGMWPDGFGIPNACYLSSIVNVLPKGGELPDRRKTWTKIPPDTSSDLLWDSLGGLMTYREKNTKPAKVGAIQVRIEYVDADGVSRHSYSEKIDVERHNIEL